MGCLAKATLLNSPPSRRLPLFPSTRKLCSRPTFAMTCDGGKPFFRKRRARWLGPGAEPSCAPSGAMEVAREPVFPWKMPDLALQMRTGVWQPFVFRESSNMKEARTLDVAIA